MLGQVIDHEQCQRPPDHQQRQPAKQPEGLAPHNRRTPTLALHRVHAPRSSPNRYNARPVRPAAINQNTTIKDRDQRASPRPSRPRFLFGVTIATRVIVPDLAPGTHCQVAGIPEGRQC